MIKKTPLSAYGNVRSGGINAITLEKDDELLSVRITDGTRQIFIGTRSGLGIRFGEADVRPMGRTATGVFGIRFKRNDDCVVEMEAVEEDGTILTVTENGFGKRSRAQEYRLQTRGGSGVINVKVTEKNGPVVGIKAVTDEDQVLIITQKGILIRLKVKGIRETGRAAMGVKLIDLDPEDRVVAVAKLAERDDADEEDEAPTLLSPPGATPFLKDDV